MDIQPKFRKVQEQKTGTNGQDAATTGNFVVSGDVLLRLADVQAKTGLGVTTIYKRMKAGDFPRALKISDTIVRWRQSDIDAWIASLPFNDFRDQAVEARSIGRLA